MGMGSSSSLPGAGTTDCLCLHLMSLCLEWQYKGLIVCIYVMLGMCVV